MKSPKLTARKIVEDHLENQLRELDRKLLNNKRQIKNLAEEQSVIKKQRSEIGKLLSVLRTKK